MHKLKLSYFDFDGGRGESIRLALAIGKIPFEDHRIPLKEWPAYKDQTPLGPSVSTWAGLKPCWSKEVAHALRCD